MFRRRMAWRAAARWFWQRPLHAPVARSGNKYGRDRHIFKRDKVQAQNQLFPVVALVQAGEKPS